MKLAKLKEEIDKLSDEIVSLTHDIEAYVDTGDTDTIKLRADEIRSLALRMNALVRNMK